jgi:hypothetical protein
MAQRPSCLTQDDQIGTNVIEGSLKPSQNSTVSSSKLFFVGATYLVG